MKIVTGVHRSGTSFVSNLLLELGANLGDDNKHINGDVWNENGYFENEDITLLNDWLILGKYSRSAYCDGGVFGRNWLLRSVLTPFYKLITSISVDEKVIEKRARLKKQKMYEFDSMLENVIVKDVRFSITLPIWLKYAGIKKILYVFRNPKEVAKSIRRRYNAPMCIGYRTWCMYVDRFLLVSDGIPTTFVYYNNFFDDDLCNNELNRMIEFIELLDYEKPVNDVVGKVLDRRLKHNEGGSGKIPKYVDKRFRKLMKIHAKQKL